MQTYVSIVEQTTECNIELFYNKNNIKTTKKQEIALCCLTPKTRNVGAPIRIQAQREPACKVAHCVRISKKNQKNSLFRFWLGV